MKIELLPVDGLPRSHVIPQDVDNVTDETTQVEQNVVISDDAVPEPDAPQRPKIRQRNLHGRLMTEEERVQGNIATRLLDRACAEWTQEEMMDEFTHVKRQRMMDEFKAHELRRMPPPSTTQRQVFVVSLYLLD